MLPPTEIQRSGALRRTIPRVLDVIPGSSGGGPGALLKLFPSTVDRVSCFASLTMCLIHPYQPTPRCKQCLHYLNMRDTGIAQGCFSYTRFCYYEGTKQSGFAYAPVLPSAGGPGPAQTTPMTHIRPIGHINMPHPARIVSYPRSNKNACN